MRRGLVTFCFSKAVAWKGKNCRMEGEVKQRKARYIMDLIHIGLH